jgi:ABC-type glycerol-3-phosphate transport system substrate-binding protein
MGLLRPRCAGVAWPRRVAGSCGRWLLVGVTGWLSACSGERVLGDYPPSSCDLAEPPAELTDTPLSIATFWAADTHEREAFQTLVDRVDARRYVPSTQQMRTRVEVQRHINDAFESQQLPDVFQVNGGSDVLRWVQDRAPESTDVCSLDRLRTNYGWSKAYFPLALAPLTCQGRLYGLPVGIHHLNVLFYNRELFAELAERAESRATTLVEPSRLKSSYELLTELGQIAELQATTSTGKPLVPLAIGTESEWPLTIIAFENVLLSLGHDAYETLWTGGLENADAAQIDEMEATLREMLMVLRTLRTFSDFSTQVSWQDAVRQVGDGEALMTITGDWGVAQLSPEQAARVEVVTFPGTLGTFVYTPDSFAVPRELKKSGFPARSFLHDVVEAKDSLIEFSNAKHSIPPRRDLTPDQIAALTSESLRSTYRQFASCNDSPETCKVLLAVSGLGPPPGTDPCFDEMDALLTFAIAGTKPSNDSLDARLCRDPFPATSAEAESRLIERLLLIGKQRFAAACR